MSVVGSRSAGRTLAGIAAVVALLNVLGWGVLLAVVAPREFQLGDAGGFGIGVGVTAFLLGAGTRSTPTTSRSSTTRPESW